MSFNFTFTGHAASKEAEAEIVKAAQKLWEMITQHHPAGHHPSAWSNGSTEHHGAGPVENLSSDNPPASADEPAEHSDTSSSADTGSPTEIPATPVAPSEVEAAPATPPANPSSAAPAAADPTQPSSYSQPSESLPQGDTGSSSSPSPSPSPSSTSSGTSESSDAYPSSQ